MEWKASALSWHAARLSLNFFNWACWSPKLAFSEVVCHTVCLLCLLYWNLYTFFSPFLNLYFRFTFSIAFCLLICFFEISTFPSLSDWNFYFSTSASTVPPLSPPLLSPRFSFEVFTFSYLRFSFEIPTFSTLSFWTHYFLILCLHFPVEILDFPIGIFTFVVGSLLSHHFANKCFFSVEVSTFSLLVFESSSFSPPFLLIYLYSSKSNALSFWNVQFLFTFLVKALTFLVRSFLSHHFASGIAAFSLPFLKSLLYLHFPVEVSLHFLLKSRLYFFFSSPLTVCTLLLLHWNLDVLSTSLLKSPLFFNFL